MRGIRFCTRRPYRWSCPAAIQRSSIQIIGSDRHVLYVLQKPSVLYPSESCARVLAHMTACVAMVDPLVKGLKWLRKKALTSRRRHLFRRLDPRGDGSGRGVAVRGNTGCGHHNTKKN